MPWQRQVADVGLELLPDGRPAYREVIVTVPRQNGKTILVLAVMLQRALGWDTPQRIIYSAQTGNDARKKLIEDWEPILKPRKGPLSIVRILTGMGNESIPFVNRSRIVLMASNEQSGHGKTLDMAVHDELFADVDDRRVGATLPAMKTRRKAQTWLTSTMGTEKSLLLNRKVELGRQAAAGDRSSGIAYFEWSADEDEDIDDPAVWWSCNPAMGYTIDEDVIRQDRESMTEGDFRRYDLNQRTATDERVIPKDAWDAVQSETLAPSEPLFYGVGVNDERSTAAIAVAGGGVLEVIEHHDGVLWVLDRLTQITQRRFGMVGIDPGSPAGSLINELRSRGVWVQECGGREKTQACGAFYDDVADRKVTVRHHVGLDAAVAGAARRWSGDSWVWAHKVSDADITPLEAVTFASWLQRNNASSVQVW